MKQAIANATKKVEAIYAYPYQNHATMEPMNTTERLGKRLGGSCTGERSSDPKHWLDRAEEMRAIADSLDW